MIGCLDQIGLYGYLLKGMEIPDPLRNDLQGRFHKFAFEYWLLCRTKCAVASPWRRYQLRQMLHREARNEHYFRIQHLYKPSSAMVSSFRRSLSLPLRDLNYWDCLRRITPSW